jgi:hypothetical protein
MKKFLISSLLFLSLQVSASHIVGGEFQLLHLAEYQYRINLIIYFDLVNGNPAGRDPFVEARIFRNSDNMFIEDVVLSNPVETLMPYTQDVCRIGAVQTSIITYSIIKRLDPTIFNDPSGYYIVWQRCCRNYQLTNIFSENPETSPTTTKYAGQTFILEFPPVVRNGAQFINSSPRLFTPRSDYACMGRMVSIDLGGTDADGDSLVYSIATPLSTNTAEAVPVGGPHTKPYPPVMWRATYSNHNVMGDESDLSLNQQGTLFVRPNFQRTGLFAFALKCEEYRNGEKIGEIRREFQLWSRDCERNEAPTISARNLEGSFAFDSITAEFDETTPDAERCIMIKVQDVDASPLNAELVHINAIPMSFNANVSEILPEQTSVYLSGSTDEAIFNVCFNPCPLSDDETFQIGIIAYDDACALPASDTVILNVSIKVPESICRRQSIDFPPINDRKFERESFQLNATASSGLPVTFISADEGVTFLEESMVSIIKPGLATIIAKQAGGEEFRSANPVKRSFCVNPDPPFLTIEPGDSLIRIVSNSEWNIWYVDDVVTPNTGHFITVSGQPAKYKARAVVDGCSSDEASLVFTDTDGMQESRVQVFPNPAHEDVSVFMSGSDHTKKISLTNTRGQTLLTDETSEHWYQFSLREFPTGIYFLKVQKGSGTEVRMVVKN